MNTPLLRLFGFALVLASALCPGATPTMRVHCIDVGQGSATLVEFKCGAVLVDTGGGSDADTDKLVGYLERFFASRSDLNRTLESVILTHCHKDHTRGLFAVASRFTVKRFMDNGSDEGSGLSDLNHFFKLVRDHPGTKILEIEDGLVAAAAPTGYTNDFVDPLVCEDCDPVVRVLASSTSVRPEGWTKQAYENQNNRSLVVRFDLGKASLLITGDSEVENLNRVLARYKTGSALDTDVLVVGHHGSKNGTTLPFLQAVTPRVALVSCGHWNDGKGDASQFNTWSYGHPNRGVLDLLASSLPSKRASILVKAGLGARKFVSYRVKKPTYCTAWDGNVVVEEDSEGKLDIVRKAP